MGGLGRMGTRTGRPINAPAVGRIVGMLLSGEEEIVAGLVKIQYLSPAYMPSL